MKGDALSDVREGGGGRGLFGCGHLMDREVKVAQS
jgi:hypothetical protein